MNGRDGQEFRENNSKLFITNLPPDYPEDQVKEELESMFEIYGRIIHLNVKKNKNGQYSFAFLEFERMEDAKRAIQEMDQKELHQRPMKVRQDRQMEGCFHCKKTGHFAKQCPNRDMPERPRGGYDERRGHQKSRQRQRRGYRQRDRQYQAPRQYRERDYRRRSRSYSGQKRRRRYSRSSEDSRQDREDYRRRSDNRKERDYERGRDYEHDRDRRRPQKYRREYSRSRSRENVYERERDRSHRRRDNHDDYGRNRRPRRSYSGERSYSRDSRGSRH